MAAKTRMVRVVRTFDRRAAHTYTEVPDDYEPAEGEVVIEIKVPEES